jgi:hypothetical protein
MDWVLALVFFFVVVPLVGRLGSNGVHRLGAWIVRHLPPRVGLFLGKHLYRTQWDEARGNDEVARARNSLRKEAGKPVEGEVLPRQ